MHFAKVLYHCSTSNAVSLVQERQPLNTGWAFLLLFGAQCRDKLHTGNGGCVPSCKGLLLPYRFLCQASLNNLNWNTGTSFHRKRSKLALLPCQMCLQNTCRFCGGGLVCSGRDGSEGGFCTFFNRSLVHSWPHMRPRATAHHIFQSLILSQGKPHSMDSGVL